MVERPAFVYKKGTNIRDKFSHFVDNLRLLRLQVTLIRCADRILQDPPDISGGWIIRPGQKRLMSPNIPGRSYRAPSTSRPQGPCPTYGPYRNGFSDYQLL